MMMIIYFAVHKNTKKANSDKIKFNQLNNEVLKRKKNNQVGPQGDYEKTSRSSSQQPPYTVLVEIRVIRVLISFSS